MRLVDRREPVRVGPEQRVTVAVSRPADFQPGKTPALVLAPGAGSDLDAPLLVRIACELGALVLVARFNFPYREMGRKVPDPQRTLEATYRAVLDWLREHPELRPGPVFAGGKSMGGRIATHVEAAGRGLAGLVLLGYPLHPPGQTARIRAAHLGSIPCPLLFVQGTRDALCGLDLLRPVLAKLNAPYRLHVIEDGDHSFKVRKRSGRSEGDVFAEICDVVREFVSEVAARPASGGSPAP